MADPIDAPKAGDDASAKLARYNANRRKKRAENPEATRERDRIRHARDREKRNAATRGNYKQNKDRYNESRRNVRLENLDDVRKAARDSYPDRRDKALAYLRKWQEENREDMRRKAREKRALAPEAARLANKANYAKHRAARIAYMQEWRKQNPTHEADRRRVDTQFHLAKTLRSRLNSVIRRKRIEKFASAIELCGCNTADLKVHIEAQFEPGMSWSNHSPTGWHIDHKRPLCTFDLTDLEQQRAAFHFSNLRPLWAIDNMTRPRKEWAA